MYWESGILKVLKNIFILFLNIKAKEIYTHGEICYVADDHDISIVLAELSARQTYLWHF